MRGEGDLQPTTKRVSMDRCDDRLGAGVEDLMGAAALDRRRAARAEGADIGAGDEAPSCADQHHRFDCRVGVAALDILDDALGHTRRKRIDRRVVNCDDTDAVDILKANQSAFRHFRLLRTSLSFPRRRESRNPVHERLPWTPACAAMTATNPQDVAFVPKMTVLCEDNTPPLPCAIAVSQSATWRAPHSWRNCRVASISRSSPYMPGWQ